MKSTMTKSGKPNKAVSSPFFAKGNDNYFFGNSGFFFSKPVSNIQRSPINSYSSIGATNKNSAASATVTAVQATKSNIGITRNSFVQRKCAECEKEELHQKEEPEVSNSIVQP